MKIYDIHTKDGGLLAFEVENTFLGRRGVVRVVRSIPGARIVCAPVRILSWFREEVFCVFEVDGVPFKAWEPYGDNSRYWIGPSGENIVPVPALAPIRAAFADANAIFGLVHHPPSRRAT